MNPDLALAVHFSPLLPISWLAGACGAAAVLLLISFFQKSRGMVLRSLCAAIFVAALMGPSLVKEEREPVKDVAAIVVDKSPSQKIGARAENTDKALAYLKTALGKIPSLEVRVVDAPKDAALSSETKLFDPLDRAMADVPRQRRAGVIFLTDGEVHDAPANPALMTQYGPAHTLLTGSKNEKDRELKIIEAPAYGIAGQKVAMKYKIEDTPNDGGTAEVTLNTYDSPPQTFSVPVNEEQTLELNVAHAGQNVFELKVDGMENELTEANNRAALIVNGEIGRAHV